MFGGKIMANVTIPISKFRVSLLPNFLSYSRQIPKVQTKQIQKGDLELLTKNNFGWCKGL